MENPIDRDLIDRDLVDLLMQASQHYDLILTNYFKLAMTQQLSDEDADQLEAIYITAEHDQLLNFFINEFDYILGKRLGVLSAESIEDYKNQQAWLREHLEENPFDQAYRIEIQELLQKQGFYDGPIDGVLGDRSVEAVQNFQKSQQLKDDGVPGKRTLSALRST